MTEHYQPSLPIDKIEELFFALEDWAVLRNAKVIDNFRRGGDCDLIVGNIADTEEKLRKHLGGPLRVARRSYVTSYFYPWGHFDLTDHYYWRGIRLALGREILDRAQETNDGIRVVERIDEAVTRLFGSLLWGGFIKKKYCPEILQVFQSDPVEFRKRLVEMTGESVSSLVSGLLEVGDWKALERNVKTIRRKILVRSLLRKPLGTGVGFFTFYFQEILLRLKPQLPLLVFDVGRDEEVEKVAKSASCFLGRSDFHLKTLGVTSGQKSILVVVAILKLMSFRANNGLVILAGRRRQTALARWLFDSCRIDAPHGSDLNLQSAFDTYLNRLKG